MTKRRRKAAISREFSTTQQLLATIKEQKMTKNSFQSQLCRTPTPALCPGWSWDSHCCHEGDTFLESHSVFTNIIKMCHLLHTETGGYLALAALRKQTEVLNKCRITHTSPMLHWSHCTHCIIFWSRLKAFLDLRGMAVVFPSTGASTSTTQVSHASVTRPHRLWRSPSKTNPGLT